MKVVVGSTNKVKVNAIKTVFNDHEVIAYDAASGVPNQPMGDDETIRGAINRATLAKEQGEIGIGLEGGVSETNQFGLHVVSYGALVDQDGKIYLAGGTRLPLPLEVVQGLKAGYELGDVMNQYANKEHVKHNEGAVGIFTNNLVKRQDIFEHIGKLLLGQMLTNINSIGDIKND